MVNIFLEMYKLFIDMSFYLMIGLLFVGILHVLVSKDWIIKNIGNNNTSSVVKASLFGVPLPLCSCGVIPTAIYLKENGASNGSVISFLISTPQTGVDNIIATYGMIGGFFTAYKAIVAFLSGIIGGTIINIFTKNENDDLKCENIPINTNHTHQSHGEDLENKGFIKKIKEILHYGYIHFLDDISVHFIIGIIISGFISYFIPNDFFNEYGIGSGISGMLLMIIIGMPMYICSTSSIPIAISLMMKGVSPGAAFIFLVVGPATNAASMTILFKVLGKKIMIIYLAVVAVLSISFGIILDLLLKYYTLDKSYIINHVHGFGINNNIKLVFGFIFFILILRSLYSRLKPKKIIHNKTEYNNYVKISIEGMNCSHCAQNVKDILSRIDGIKDVSIELREKSAYISCKSLDELKIRDSLSKVGYEVTHIAKNA